MFGFGNDSIDSGFQSEGDIAFGKGNSFEIDGSAHRGLPCSNQYERCMDKYIGVLKIDSDQEHVNQETFDLLRGRRIVPS
jgi:hypothetical protein